MPQSIFRRLRTLCSMRRWPGPAGAAAFVLAAVWHLPGWAALGVQMQANSHPAEPGEALSLTFVVSNTDGFNRNGVVMRMPFPAGLASTSHGLIEGGACNGTVSNDSSCQPTETVVWNLGTVPAGSSVVLTMTPSIATTTLPGTSIVFAAEVADTSGNTASTADTVTVVQGRVLQLAFQPLTPQPVAPGGELTYQASFGHTASSSVATQAVLSLPIPAGMSVLAATDGGFVAGGNVQWNLGTLNPGQTGERRVTFRVPGALAAGGAVKATASLGADGGKLARAVALTRIGSPPPLMAALTVDNGPAVPGEALRSTLTISNPFFFTRSGVTARMRFPAGLATLSHGLVERGSCDGTVSNNSSCEPRETLVWSLGDLEAGRSISVTLPPSVDTGALPGTVIPFDLRFGDSSGSVGSVHAAIETTNSRALQLQLAEVQPQPLLAGALFAYQLSFGHTAASSVATNAALELDVPPGLEFVTASDGGSFAQGKVRWSLGTLNPGQVGERRVTFRVSGNVPEGSLLRPEARLDADGGKLVRADGILRVESASGLLAALDVNATPAVPGEVLAAKLTVSNTSFFDRSGLVGRMRFPVGLDRLSHGLIEAGDCDGTVSNNSSCESREALVWNLGTLPAGRSTTVQLPPTLVSGLLPGSLLPFEVQVLDSAGNSVQAKETVEVVNSRTLQLGLSETTQEPVLPGAALSYQLAFGNSAGSAVSAGATLELAVPEGLSFVSASDGGSFSDRKVRWTIGTLNPAQVGRREVRLSVDPLGSLTAGTLVKLEAVLRDGAGRIVRADDTTRIETEAPLGLNLALTSGARLPGETLGMTMSVTNRSAFSRANVVLNLQYPLGLANLPHSQTGGGACNGTVSNDSSCQPLETLVWNLGTVPAGATVTRSLDSSLLGSVLPGSVIEVGSWVADANARSRATQLLRVGAASACESQGGDSDGDGVCDAVDNCSLVANADQRDSDGDGIGNRCDADFDNNGVVNTLDLIRLKADFGKTGASLVTDLNGDGVVNNTDLAIFKTLFGKPPGPSGRR